MKVVLDGRNSSGEPIEVMVEYKGKDKWGLKIGNKDAEVENLDKQMEYVKSQTKED